jgi:GNAT superfamily N-acetyltransferase
VPDVRPASGGRPKSARAACLRVVLSLGRCAPFEDWLAHDMRGSGDKPEATFLAVADDEVVGYAKFSLTAAHSTTAHHDLTAVRRAWRGRGLARALKAAQISWAIENGYQELHTRNEQRNEPIRRLNERLGYHIQLVSVNPVD